MFPFPSRNSQGYQQPNHPQCTRPFLKLRERVLHTFTPIPNRGKNPECTYPRFFRISSLLILQMLFLPDRSAALAKSFNPFPFRLVIEEITIGRFTPVTTSALPSSTWGKQILVGVPPRISVKTSTPFSHDQNIISHTHSTTPAPTFSLTYHCSLPILWNSTTIGSSYTRAGALIKGTRQYTPCPVTILQQEGL